MRIKGFISLMLASFLALSLCACAKADDSEVISSSKPSDEPTKEWREPAEKESTEKFVDTDGDFEFSTVDFGLSKNYVIIVPKNDIEATKSAKTLQSFLAEKAKLNLQIKTDNTSATSSEILIGKTNRSESNKDLKENELEVSVKGSKLVFSGGHPVTVNSAVDKFVRLAPEKGKAVTFKLSTDFTSTVLDGYKYVWGDEFEGNDINLSKWDFVAHMSGTKSIELSWGKETTDVSDGRLKLRAIRYYNPHNSDVEFRVPYSTVTRYKMNYVYGYAEIRARIPFTKGVWPSFWALTSRLDQNGKIDNDYINTWDYNIEIDVFEVFGTESKVVPAVHKWYKAYNYIENHDPTRDSNHTSIGGKAAGGFLYWDFAERGHQDLSNLNNEYHTYGFEWTEKELSMYVDGQKYTSLSIAESFDKYDDMSHFHDPIFILFNNHVFANDSSYKPNIINNNLEGLPAEYFIDWFRVYQKPGVGKLYIDETVRSYEGR